MRVEACADVRAPADVVWDVVTDPWCVPEILAGVTRWESAGDVERGLGARYRVRMQVGSAEVGGLIEVVEFDERRDMAWTTVTGVEHRGRWRLRPGPDGSTRVVLRLSYSAPGGFLGLLADRFSAPMVRRNLQASVERVRDRAEAAAARSA